MPSHAASTRITTIDALRGFALLGILFAHFIYWHSGGPLPQIIYEPGRYGIASGIVSGINGIFIFGKFYTFFAFLFGLSFYLQMQSMQKKGENFTLRYSWRLLILLAIGIIHQTFWMGDILSIYAIIGFALLPIRKMRDKALLITGILLVLNVPGKIWEAFKFFFIHYKQPDDGGKLANDYFNMILHGNIYDVVTVNWRGLENKFFFQVSSGRLLITLGFFVLGMYTGRRKWFESAGNSKPIFKKICKGTGFIVLATVLIALALVGINALLKLNWEQNPVVGYFFGILFDINSAAMVLFYISGLTMLMYRRRWQSVLYKLAPVGKMALTSYLAQTVFGLFLFYHIGLGLASKTTPAWNWVIAIVIYALQVMITRWWFKYFKYGPVEWLWRSGTMMRWQPFLKTREIIGTNTAIPA
jgi:uncharacterized protein